MRTTQLVEESGLAALALLTTGAAVATNGSSHGNRLLGLAAAVIGTLLLGLSLSLAAPPRTRHLPEGENDRLPDELNAF